jgi:hypoxanthine phosphoribosyltransferase
MRFTITNWEYMDSLCRKLADQIMEDNYKPDCIVALARGGWFAGSMLCDMLGVRELVSVRAKHYSATTKLIPEVVKEDFIHAKGKVLIVDDVANTGRSLELAEDLCRGVEEVRTAVLMLIQSSSYTPDYFGDYLIDDVWVIFPWNFYEEMTDLIERVADDEFACLWEFKWKLYERFGIDPTALEISQPGKLEFVLEEMVRKGILEEGERRGEKIWRINHDSRGT